MKSVRTIIFSALIFLLLPQLSWAANIDSLNRLKYPPGALRVVINGTGFSGVNEVQIFDVTNGVQVAAPRFFIKSDTQIVARPTLWAGTYFIKVKTPQGTSNASPTFAVGSDPPIISAISPTTIPAGTPNMVITGDNFTGVRIVRIYNALTNKRVCDASFTVNSNYHITAAAALTSGSYFLKVITYFGVSNNSQTIHVSPSMAFSLSIVKVNDIDRLKLTVTLDSRATQVTTVEYKAVSGQSSMIFDQPLQGVTTSSGILTFQVDRLQRSVYLPFREGVDKAIMVTLSNPVNATLKSPSLSENLDRKVLVNVKGSDFNAAGDGVTDDTAAIQKASNTIYNYGGGMLIFPAGTYLTKTVSIRENITYQGLGAILKRPDNAGFSRTFTNQQYRWSGVSDSPPLTIKGLIFDGNVQNNAVNEQLTSVFLMADANKPGRLKAYIEDCTFRNSPGDGLTIYSNVDLVANNINGYDTARGAICLVGGYTKISVTNVTFWGDDYPSRLHIEQAGGGYGGEWGIVGTFENIETLTGGFICTAYGNSNLNFKKFRMYKKSLSISNGEAPHNASFTFEDCRFTCGIPWLGSGMIYAPQNVTFNRCEFYATRNDGRNESLTYPFACVGIYIFPLDQRAKLNQTVTFNNCIFMADQELIDYVAKKYPNDPHKIAAIYSVGDKPEWNNQVTLNNCEIRTGIQCGIKFKGGNLNINGLVNNANNLALWLSSPGTDGWLFNANINSMVTTSPAFIKGLWANHIENRIKIGSIVSYQLLNVIGSYSGSISDISVTSNRIIMGDEPPNNYTNGFEGEIFCLNNSPDQRWVCTKRGYLIGSSQVMPAIWEPQ